MVYWLRETVEKCIENYTNASNHTQNHFCRNTSQHYLGQLAVGSHSHLVEGHSRNHSVDVAVQLISICSDRLLNNRRLLRIHETHGIVIYELDGIHIEILDCTTIDWDRWFALSYNLRLDTSTTESFRLWIISTKG